MKRAGHSCAPRCSVLTNAFLVRDASGLVQIATTLISDSRLAIRNDPISAGAEVQTYLHKTL